MKFRDLMLSTECIKEPLIVALQGVSCEVSETASYLKDTLDVLDFKTLIIKTESYYKTVNWNAREDQIYDFDNPAAIDWNLLRKTFRDIYDTKRHISMCKFDAQSLRNIIFLHKNPFSEVIVLEGKHVFNLFSDKLFNISQFDCKKPQSQEIDVEYIDNPNDFHNDFKIIKVLFLSKADENSKSMSDPIVENKDDFKREEIEKYCIGNIGNELRKTNFSKNSRWINHVTQADFVIEEGKNSSKIINDITEKVLNSVGASLLNY